MKIQFAIKRLTDYIFCNRTQYLIVLLCLLAGTVIGSLMAVSFESDGAAELSLYLENFTSAYTIQAVNKNEVFILSLYGYVKMLIIMGLSVGWIGLIPVNLFQVGAKGYKLGFTSTFIMTIWGYKGLLFSAVFIIPQIIIILPTIVTYSVFSVNAAIEVHNLKKKGQRLITNKNLQMKNLIVFIVVLILVCVYSSINAYIIPTIFKSVCTIMKNIS